MSPGLITWLNRLSVSLAAVVVIAATLYVLAGQPSLQTASLSAAFDQNTPLGAMRCLWSRHR